MEDKYLFIVRDQDGDICGMSECSDDCSSISTVALLVKDKIDYCRHLEGKAKTEYVEIWVRDDPRNMHLLATPF